MCRWLIYFGNEILLKEILFTGENSIIKQSYKKTFTPFLEEPNKRDHEINADGFGIGWYSNKIEEPCIYISTNTPWSDVNIKRLSNHISSKFIFAHIRAIKPLSQSIIHEYNCHPFNYKNFMFMHNGDLKNFVSFKKKIIHNLNDKVFNLIKGNTDSEFVFAIFLNFLSKKIFKKGGILEINYFRSLVLKTIKKIESYQPNIPMSMNFAFTDGKSIICTRYINTNEEPPSLYFRVMNKSVIISSEPVDYDDNWKYITKNNLVIYNKNTISIEPIKIE